MWKTVMVIQTLLRLIVPAFIPLYPLPATIISILLDIDAYVCFKNGMRWRDYHVYDKILDYWFYVMILIASLNTGIFVLVLTLFLVRSIGQFLSLKTRDTKYLVFFPNVLELYFVSYLMLTTFGFNQTWITDFHLLLFLYLVALIREVLIHVIKFCPDNLFGLNLYWEYNERGKKRR